MMMNGVALLAACYLIGQLFGELLGRALGVQANVGGVGFAMIALIAAHQWFEKRKWFSTEMEKGILFWSNLYIPVIIAMSATQNVRGALSGGWIALLAGIVPTGLCFLLIPVLRKMIRTNENSDWQP